MLFAFVVGGLGFEFCVFVAGWRHALRSEWPFIIIIIKVVVDGRHKNQSGLYHYLSDARAAPGVGQLGKGKIPFRILGQVFSRK